MSVRIHQAVVGARIGDAITQIALQLRAALRDSYESEIFALYVDPSAAGEVVPLKALADECSSDDVVLVHVSIGDPAFEETVEACPARVVVVYHNVTPHEFFLPFDPGFALLLLQGRRLLQRLAARAECALSYSQFNLAELRTARYEVVFEVPLAVDPFRLMRHEGDPTFALAIRDRVGRGPVFLSVGQVLPHKNAPLLIGAHHLLTSHHDPSATLVIAGSHAMPHYARYLQRIIDSFGLNARVWMTGVLTEGQLAELYRAADVWVSASLHEGFCVPAIEAMAASLPIVTVDAGATPETVGDAGLVVPVGAAEMCEGMLAMYRRRNDAAMLRHARLRARRYAEADPAGVTLAALRSALAV